MVDASLQRTFTISNSDAGTLALVPSSLVLPEGFSLHTAFPDTVGPDDSTSFTVGLDATDAGYFSGTLSFNTNDGDEDPSAFYVSGEVTGSSAANLSPTLDAIANPPAIDEDAGMQTVGLTGITAGGSEIQNLSVTARSSNPQLVPNPSVTYTSPGTGGTLTFVPAANQTGVSLITVTVTDDGGTGYGGVDRVEQSFLVTVAPVNDSPALVQAIAPIVVSEGSVMTTVGLATYFQDVDLATSGDTLHYEVTLNAPDPEEPLYKAELLAAWIENGGLKVVYGAGRGGSVLLHQAPPLPA